jgi:hypothetical protein
MGFPAGLPKTMVVDLSGHLDPRDPRIRLKTTMRLYWDWIAVMLGGQDNVIKVQRLGPASAELRFGGYPRPVSPDGKPPFGYDPDNVAPDDGWKAHVGDYTSYGDVTELLRQIDDRFVVTRSGDEIELVFDAPEPPPPGMQRSFLLYADGFGKDMDLNSAAAEMVGPMPFHGMPVYPYAADVQHPVTEPPGERGRRVLLDPGGAPGVLPVELAAAP